MASLPEDQELAERSELAEFCCDLARRAGRLLMEDLPLGRFGGTIEEKAGRELVSQVDRRSEQLIRQKIAARYPDHRILGEEEGESGGDGGQGQLRWIVDPLDGTTNFLHGLPIFCVSIGLEEVVEPPALPRLLAGAVYLPYVDELFFAYRGGGAYLNSRSLRLTVSDTARLDDAVVATGFAYDRERFPNYDNFVRLARSSRGIRRCGSAAIDLAWLAAGRLDAFWELGLRAYDVAAGALLVQEAGGQVSDCSKGGDWLHGCAIIASNGVLHDQVQLELEPWPAGEPA